MKLCNKEGCYQPARVVTVAPDGVEFDFCFAHAQEAVLEHDYKFDRMMDAREV